MPELTQIASARKDYFAAPVAEQSLRRNEVATTRSADLLPTNQRWGRQDQPVPLETFRVRAWVCEIPQTFFGVWCQTTQFALAEQFGICERQNVFGIQTRTGRSPSSVNDIVGEVGEARTTLPEFPAVYQFGRQLLSFDVVGVPCPVFPAFGSTVSEHQFECLAANNFDESGAHQIAVIP